jgi:hypothetical protein
MLSERQKRELATLLNKDSKEVIVNVLVNCVEGLIELGYADIEVINGKYTKVFSTEKWNGTKTNKPLGEYNG